MTWKPDICVYHGGCDDGFGAALAVHLRWDSDVVYVPGNYAGFAWPSALGGKRILFVDFSLKATQMREFVSGGIGGERPHSVVVLDHHKTAEAELAPWSIGGKQTPPCDLRGRSGGRPALARIDELLALNEMENIEPIVAFFDMHKSGARMAWEFCHPHMAVPRFIEYIEDRDLWRFALAETKAISAALRTYPHDFDLWSGFLSDTSRLLMEGGAVLRGHEKNIREFCRHAYEMEICGYTVPVVNVPYHYASDTANELLKLFPAAPFAACWFQLGPGARLFSLRSEDSRADVSEVAKSKGGGGHRNAAGFTESASSTVAQ